MSRHKRRCRFLKLEISFLQEHEIESEVEEDKIQGKILVLIINREGEREYAYGRM
jgi:hypothetical protein